jgi:hypothetical protein
MKMKTVLIMLFCAGVSGALVAQEPAAAADADPVAVENPATSEASPEASPAPSGGVDDLFGDGAGDVVAPQVAKVDLSPILANPVPGLSGSITVTGKMLAGWKAAPDIADLSRNFDGGLAYQLGSGLSLDYRPDPTFHWSGSVAASIAAGSYSWSGISVGNMYIDYTLLDTVFFTIGKFGMGWGVGRIFNVNDLVSSVNSGLAIKSFVPLGPVGWTAVILAQPGFFTNPSSPSYQELGYATQFEASLGPINLGLSGFYQRASTPKLDLYIKSVLAGVDLFAEGKLALPSGKDPTVTAMGGFFWEGLEPKLKIQGEYQFDSTNPAGTDHSVSIGTSLAAIPGTGIRVSAKWTHAFVDNSGQVVVGLESDPLPHIHVALGVPICYGADGSRWVAATKAEYSSVFALGLKVDISAGF